MALEIHLEKNHFPGNPHEYFFRSRSQAVLDIEGFIDLLVANSSAINPSEIRACLKIVREKLIDALAIGIAVHTDFGLFRVIASGTAEKENTPFLPHQKGSGHRLELRIIVDKKMEKEILRKIEIQRTSFRDSLAPRISSHTVIGNSGNAAQGGDIVILRGIQMKFDPKDIHCGVFLETGTESVRLSLYSLIRPGMVHTILPRDIPSGEYRILVKVNPNGSGIHTGMADKMLTII